MVKIFKQLSFIAMMIVASISVQARDRDGDGVPDDKDACPKQAGAVTNANGCPSAHADSERVLTLRFDTGKWQLTSKQVETLTEWVGYWHGHQLLVKGHTDPRGDSEQNLALSQARANSVAETLTLRLSVAPNLITVHALGESTPLPGGDDDASDAMNRRVEVVAQPIVLQLTQGD